jgi:hypothetical protein
MTNSYGFPGNQRDQTRGVRNVIDAAVDNRQQGRNVMRTMFRAAIAATFAFVLVGMCFVSKASAQCASVLSSNVESIQPQLLEGQPVFMPASFPVLGSQNDGIVGFWRAKFISEGNSGIPDGTLIDNPFVEWHSDGTEIMNSTRAPVTQSFCMGVWQKTGKSSYELNHFALSFDTSNNFVGPAQIQEDVTLDKKADQYTGTFKIDQYDPSGNVLAEVVGNITAIRITVNTTIQQVL